MTQPFGTFPLTLTGTPIPGALLRLQSASGQVHCDPTTGPGGSSGKYQHTQNVAVPVWAVAHNLGWRPNIRAYTPGGREMLAEIVHSSTGLAYVYFDSATAGFAVCS